MVVQDAGQQSLARVYQVRVASRNLGVTPPTVTALHLAQETLRELLGGLPFWASSWEDSPHPSHHPGRNRPRERWARRPQMQVGQTTDSSLPATEDKSWGPKESWVVTSC